MSDNKLGATLEKLQAQSNLSWLEFAKLCGVSRTYMYRMRGGHDVRSRKPLHPTITVLLGIADALEISRVRFLQQCGYLKRSDILRYCAQSLRIKRK